MRVHLAKWGNSTAVRLPKAVVQELGLENGQEIELTVSGGEARLKPLARDAEGDLLARLIAECDAIGWENQPALVDWGPDVGAEIIDDEYSNRPSAVAGSSSKG